MTSHVFYNHVSELATLTNLFEVNGVATDPATISLVVTDPTGTATTYTFASGQITRLSAGSYTKDVSCAASVDGVWTGLWVGTGPATDVQPVTWIVFGTAVSQRYCSMEDVKSRLSISDAQDDYEIALAVEAASRGIDEICERRFWRGTDTQTYIPQDLYEVKVDDIVSVTTLKTDSSGDGNFEQTWATTDYQLLPFNPTQFTETRPYTAIRAVGSLTFPLIVSGILARNDRVEITGVFGWPTVPLAVRQAALIMSVELLKLKGAPFGVAGFDGFGAVRVRDNPIAMRLLGPYRRHPLLVR